MCSAVYVSSVLGRQEAATRAGWLSRTVENGGSLTRELREAAGVLEWHRPFLAPLYAWVAAAPASAYLPHPLAVHLALTHLRDRFEKSCRSISCRPLRGNAAVACFADASAQDGKVILGGWEAVFGAPPSQCRWFSIGITSDHAPWLFPGGRPSRTIASSELLATMACLTLFAKDAPRGARSSISVTSAFTDNRGNTYAAAKLLSTKYPLSCMVMELATQMELRGVWLDLTWTPWEQNTLADKLTSDDLADFADFDPRLRVGSSFGDLRFEVLESLFRAGADLEARKAELLKQRRETPPKRPKTDSLRTRDPW